MVVPRQMSVYGVHLEAIAIAITRGAGELYVLIMARLRSSFALAPHHGARRSSFALVLGRSRKLDRQWEVRNDRCRLITVGACDARERARLTSQVVHGSYLSTGPNSPIGLQSREIGRNRESLGREE